MPISFLRVMLIRRKNFRREGPFGDHTGFYSLEDDYPVFHLTCITHRKNAIYPATVVGIPPQEDAWIARATERIFMLPVRKTVVPEMTDMEIPDFGVAHNLTIAGISKSYPGQARKVMNALWGAGQMMFNKLLIIADESANIHDLPALARELRKIDPQRDIIFSSGPLDVLDHSADVTGYGSKVGIDLTNKLKEELLIRFDVHKTYEKEVYSWDDLEGLLKDEACVPPDHDMKGYCFLSIVKKDNYSFSKFCASLAESDRFEEYDFFILADSEVDAGKTRDFLWYILNNVEPQRDIRRLKDSSDRIRIICGWYSEDV